MSLIQSTVSGLDIRISCAVWPSEFLHSETFFSKAYLSTLLQILSWELRHAQWSPEFLSSNVQTSTSTFFIKRALTNFSFLLWHPIIKGVLPTLSCWSILILSKSAWSTINFANLGSSSQAVRKTIFKSFRLKKILVRLGLKKFRLG